MCMCHCACACVCVCVCFINSRCSFASQVCLCVCARERERETDKEREREREKERKRESHNICVCHDVRVSLYVLVGALAHWAIEKPTKRMAQTEFFYGLASQPTQPVSTSYRPAGWAWTNVDDKTMIAWIWMFWIWIFPLSGDMDIFLEQADVRWPSIGTAARRAANNSLHDACTRHKIVRNVCGCTCARIQRDTRTHTAHVVLGCKPRGQDKTPGGPKGSRWTNSWWWRLLLWLSKAV